MKPLLPENDRSTLDEALFGDLDDPHTLPADTTPVALGTLSTETPIPPLPSPLSWPPEEPAPVEDSRRAVRDGGTEYQLAGLGPGVFEMRAVPAPTLAAPEPNAPAAEPVAEAEDEPAPVLETPAEPPGYFFDEPESAHPQTALEGAEPDDDELIDEEELIEDDPIEEPAPANAPEAEEPRPACVLETNELLELPAGETVVLSRGHLRLSGPEPSLIDVMILSPAEHGALLRDGFALTGGDVFTQEDVNQGKIGYRHDGGDASADQFTFATPDGEVQPTVFRFAIQSTHRSPDLRGPGQLADVLDGCLIRDVLDDQARCQEPDVEAGLAVVALAGRGTWHYSLDDRRTWLELTEAQHGKALPLRAGDAIRFVPKPGWSGIVKLTYRAWDGSQGTAGQPLNLAPRDAVGGTTAFSRQTASATMQVKPEAPQTPPAEPWRAELHVGELFGDGAAIVRAEGPGEWQFSTDDGRSWQEFGKVYHGRARLLRGTDRVRFVRRRGAVGKVILAGRTWEGRGATGAANLATRSSYGDGTAFGEFVQTRTWRLSEE